MKMKQPHIVPLATQVVAILEVPIKPSNQPVPLILMVVPIQQHVVE